MCNSAATFQAMMDKIFKKEIEENLIIVYMDDILAFSKTIDGLKKIERIILKKAQSNLSGIGEMHHEHIKATPSWLHREP
jgi:hypothetical protein